MENRKNNNIELHLGYSNTGIYEESFDINTIEDNLIIEYKQHYLRKISVAVPIILHYISFGIINFFYFGSLHGKLPKIKDDDFGAGKAIGFLFIPIFNVFYWYHQVYARLANRLNFQHKLRNSDYRVDTGFSIMTSVLGLIPFLNYITILILGPILVYRLQKSINLLVEIDNPSPILQEIYNHPNYTVVQEQENEIERTFSENAQTEICPDCGNKNTEKTVQCICCNYPLKEIEIPQRPEIQQRQTSSVYATPSTYSSSTSNFEITEYTPSQYVLMLAGVVGIIAFFLPFFEFSFISEVKLSGFDELKGILKWITSNKESSEDRSNFFDSFPNPNRNDNNTQVFIIIITGLFLILGPLLYGFFSIRMLFHALSTDKYDYRPIKSIGRGLIYTVVGFIVVAIIAHEIGLPQEVNFFQIVGSGFWLANVSLIIFSISALIHYKT